jgi:hypothetical protein
MSVTLPPARLRLVGQALLLRVLIPGTGPVTDRLSFGRSTPLRSRRSSTH